MGQIDPVGSGGKGSGVDTRFHKNFGMLVLGCIEADVCKQTLILQHFTIYIICTHLHRSKLNNLANFLKFSERIASKETTHPPGHQYRSENCGSA